MKARANALHFLLSAGVHGNETAPIELLDRLLRGIARNELHPAARILFLFGNPEAMRCGERYVEQDLNRLFSGRHEQSSGFEAIRACDLEHLSVNFFGKDTGRTRLHYDLHTAIRASKIEQFALYPWQEGRAHSRHELQRLCAAARVPAITAQGIRRAAGTAYELARPGAGSILLGHRGDVTHSHYVSPLAILADAAAKIPLIPGSDGEPRQLRLW